MTTETEATDRDRRAQADALRDMLQDADGPLSNVRRGHYVAYAVLNDRTGEVAVGLEKMVADNLHEALGSAYLYLGEQFAAEDGYRPPVLRVDADHFFHLPGLENPLFLHEEDDEDALADDDEDEALDIIHALDADDEFFLEVRELYRRRLAG